MRAKTLSTLLKGQYVHLGSVDLPIIAATLELEGLQFDDPEKELKEIEDDFAVAIDEKDSGEMAMTYLTKIAIIVGRECERQIHKRKRGS
ncbi:MAG: hypothetical protein KGI41_03015 [Patescibacteria group bacterium]|nr:hypothetical protein [Patescibacteria group bacterium]MDE1966185.1 hypothetical protein [Patescibacteria group bacterium]